MKDMATYDWMESVRNTNEWLGASARAMASYPVWGLVPHPMFKVMSAWGRITERSFARMVIKPDWGIRTMVGEDGRDHIVEVDTLVSRPFGDLIHFRAVGRPARARRILLVAPMSGHYATLLRSTVASLLPDCEVYVTDWKNARDIPVSEGKFDIEDYTLYLVDFMRHLGPDINVVAVCQPAPLTLAATAYLAGEDPAAQPRTLTLIGGPIDPDAAPTEVTDFGDPAGRLQICGCGPQGLSGPAAAGLLHLHEPADPYQGLPGPDRPGRAWRGQRARQAQPIL
jgi:poly(3-hydroxybutyrate) depolymerase